jgi:diguanylate cyclase (GGDEF)-like protein
MDPAARRLSLLGLSGAMFAAVTAAFVYFERPNLGVGHFYYLPIVVLAIGAGPWAGAAGGVLAAFLYNVGVFVNPHIPSTLEGEQTVIRVTTFCAVGVVVGSFAQWKRSLLSELEQLANRDQLTGLPNTRAFEDAIARRLGSTKPFALVVGDVDELREFNAVGRNLGDDALRQLADRLLATRRGAEVARVGGDEFAVLADLPPDGARGVALSLETALSSPGSTITFGWATYPEEGENALALYRVADERLYARKVARGYRRGFEHAAL